MKTVLSIDGGGVRGLMSCQLLIELEKRLNTPIHNHIDMFAGTSTGGLLTALLNTGKFTAQQCSDLYLKNAKRIFTKNILSINGLIAPKYSHWGIEAVLLEYFGDMLMSDLLKPCIIPAVDINNRKVRFFAQHDKEPYLVRDVCRATSAAETYFKPHVIGDMVLTDAGTACNNPTLCASSEMLNLGYAKEDLFFISIGTGTVKTCYPNNNWGEVKWIQPLIDIFMGNSSEMVDYHMSMLYQASQQFRAQTLDFGSASVEMDCTTDQNLEALIAMGKRMTLKFDRELDKAVEKMTNKKAAH